MRFHVQQTRGIGAELMGRGLYEEMLVWEDAETTMSGAVELEFARIWKPIPKVVFSTTLEQVQGNARLASDNVAGEVARLREAPGEGAVSVGRRPGLHVDQAGPHRRVPAVRHSGRAGRRHAVLPAAGPRDLTRAA